MKLIEMPLFQDDFVFPSFKEYYDVKIGRKCLSLLDYTSLSSTDHFLSIEQVCYEAKQYEVAAVCVYPAFISTALSILKNTSVAVATVAGNFPYGLSDSKSMIYEVSRCKELGAQEIDVVIPRMLVLNQQWEDLFLLLKAYRQASENCCLKVILSVGEILNTQLIYKASWVALCAGADFIKTSTGKEVRNAEFETAYPMLKAIQNYAELTDRKVGFKAAGGISYARQCIEWHEWIHEILGNDWIQPKYLRIGSSKALKNLLFFCNTKELI